MTNRRILGLAIAAVLVAAAATGLTVALIRRDDGAGELPVVHALGAGSFALP